MGTRNPTGWMWQEACELLDQAERLHRQFFQLGVSDRARPRWEPPANVYEDAHNLNIIVALPGVADRDIEVVLDGGYLAVRAESTVPCGGPDCEVLRLEIPYGHFERRIPLPAGRYEAAMREFKNGCLILTLRKLD